MRLSESFLKIDSNNRFREKHVKKANIYELGSVFIYSEEMGRFDFGPDHPFKPERVIKTYDLCSRYGLINHPWIRILNPAPLDADILMHYHTQGYIQLLQEASRGEVRLELLEHGLGTRDTPILRGIYEWSLKAAGGTHVAFKDIVNGSAQVAFNPFGGFHHGMPDHAEGFCYINDIVITIKDIKAQTSPLKIAYLDFDAHHGNGVQNAFYDDSSVLFISLHETGETLYPWSGNEKETGEAGGKGFTVNVPLQPQTDDEIYSYVLDEVVYPLMNSFGPDVVIAQVGADVLVSDPLTHLKLTNNICQKAIREVMEICPKILCLGGGGYDLYRTARCWTLIWAILNQIEPMDEFAGLVGGMMFGPEMEVGSLYDHPYRTAGDLKEKAFHEARSVVNYIKKEIFPIHGLTQGKIP
jgi:acetoin utilization protein AcuC